VCEYETMDHAMNCCGRVLWRREPMKNYRVVKMTAAKVVEGLQQVKVLQQATRTAGSDMSRQKQRQRLRQRQRRWR